MIGHLNVNSLGISLEIVKGEFDVYLISEAKTGELILNQQFKINGYKTIRRDTVLEEQIPSNVLTLESIYRDIEL